MSDSLAIKKDMKSRQPAFKRQDAHKQAKSCQSWRKARGWQSKVRLGWKGYNVKVKPGYRTPVDARDICLDGFKRVVVSCLKDLDKVNTKIEKVLIGAAVGTRQKILLLDKAQKLNITVANVKDVAAFLKNVQEKQAKKKEVKKSRDTKRAKEVAKNKEAEKKDLDKKIESQEDKKEAEKKEKEKILTRKQ